MKLDEYTYTTQSENDFPPVTFESMMQAVKELEPLLQQADEIRRKLEEMGLRYDSLTDNLIVIDPYKLPDYVRKEWLRQLDERTLWNQPIWNLEDNEA